MNEDLDFKKITKIYNNAMKKMAQKITNNLEKKYKFAINEFYKDYDPWYYDRGYNLYKGFKRVSKRGYLKSDNGYMSGITVSDAYIGNNPYHQDREYVYMRSFSKGIHGINRNDAIGRGWERLREKHIPINTNPSPQTLVERQYKQIIKKKNMDELFDECIKLELR